VFFIFLYIGPVNFAPYDVPSAIVEQPQIQPENQYVVSTDYNVVLAADTDDDYWDDGSHMTASTTAHVLWYGIGRRSSQWRFQLNIAKDMTIDSANFTVYEASSLGATLTAELRRIDEDDVGSLEGDSSLPAVTDTNLVEWEFDGTSAEWETIDITDIVQDQVNLGGWASGQYIGFRMNGTEFNDDDYCLFEDYQHASSNHPYLNITYSSNLAPENTVTPSCSNLDDTDNMYNTGTEYQITVNTTDPNGFADIAYVDFSTWVDSRGAELWRVRFDEDTDTFSEQYDPNNIITLNIGSSTNVSSGNNVNVTFYVALNSNHPAIWDVDAKQYVVDAQPASDTDWYEVNWDLGPEADWLTGWNRRKYHIINQTVGTDENYTVPLWVVYGDGTDSGDKVYLNESVNNDFSDVRWTSADGTTLLDFNLNQTQIESYTDYYTNDSLKMAQYPGCYPAAWYYNNRTYVVYHGPNGADANAGDPYIRYYDHENSTWSDIVKVGDTPLTEDDHGAPCLFINNTGHIHVFFGSHNSVVKHSVSTNPEDITAWTVLSDPFDGTYPHISYDSDNNVVHAYLRGHVDSNNYLFYYNSSDGGNTWSDPQHLIHIDYIYPYMEGAGGLDPYDNQILHIGWCEYNSSYGGQNQNVYYLYLNVTTGIIYNVTGHSQGTIIETKAGLDNCKVYDSSDKLVWGPSVHVDSDSNPYLIWGLNTAPVTEEVTQFTYWNGSSWGIPVNISEPSKASGPHDFIVHSSTSITAFIGDDDDICRYTWDGETWTLEEYIYNATAQALVFSMVPHGTPNGMLGYNDTIQVIFCEWFWGNEAWAWGTRGIVGSNSTLKVKFYVTVPTNLTEYDGVVYIYYDKSDATSASQQLDYTTGNDPNHGAWGTEELSENVAPTNDQTPTCTNPDDTDNLYAQYREYKITANVTDSNGALSISYLEISLYSNDRGTLYWTVRFTEDTASFSEQADANNMIALNITESTNSTSGNTLNVTFFLMVHWNHTDTLNTDIKQTVYDDYAESDTDWYEVDYDVETRLDILDLTLNNETSGAGSRSDLFVTGKVIYYGSASNVSPTTALVDVWVTWSEDGGGSASDTTLSAGLFNVTSVSVGTTTTEYTVKVVEVGEGSEGADLSHATHTVTYTVEGLPTTTTTTTTTTTGSGIFYDLFLSLEIWGLFGPLGLVIVGYFVAKKEPKIGILFFVVECVVVARYLALVAVTPYYWWPAIIVLLGGVFTCLGPLIER